MKLKQVSRLFFGMVSLVLLLNLGLLQGVRLAQDHIESTFSRAEEAHAEVDDLVQGTELLASLVQSYHHRPHPLPRPVLRDPGHLAG
jgi:hypothetical protein